MADEKQISLYMKNLQITREEALELIETDKAIDKGEKLFDLDPELEKGAKKARQGDRKANSTPVKREKKAKPEKANICNAMMQGLETLGVEGFDVANSEREFSFTLNGTKYKVTLACPRS